MLIDPFTVAAQAFNFIALVWLLKRFLYAPVLAAIDARDQQIEEKIQQATAREAAAQNEREGLQHQQAELAKQRQELLEKAVGEAGSERERLLKNARQEAEALRVKLEEAARSERARLNQEISTRVPLEVFAIARQVLSDLANASLDQCMAHVFLQRLETLDEEQRSLLRVAGAEPAILHSASPFPEALQTALATALQQTLGQQVGLQFEVQPGLLSGLELTSNGHKLAWSGADYFASLEKLVTALLQPQAPAHAG